MNLRKRPAPSPQSSKPKKNGPKPKKQKTTTALVQTQLQSPPTALVQTQLQSPPTVNTPQPPKKKKRRKSTDPSVNKTNLKNKKNSQKSPSDGKGLLYMRCFSDKTCRTTFLINGNIIETIFDPSINLSDLFTSLQKKLREKTENNTEIPTHRKPIEIMEFNVNGSPVKVKVKSPSKKPGEEQPVLPRVAKINFISFYSDRDLLIPLEKLDVKENIDPNSSFFQSDVYQAIKQTPDKIKLISTKVTEDSLKETDKEIKNLGGKRAMTQNQVMAAVGHKPSEASANKYAKATKLFEFEAQWEWLHEIAHSVLGTRSQDEKNLVAGTHPANTNMLFVELRLEKLAKDYPQGFTLTAKAHKIPGTEIASLIEYTITTADFTLPFIFIAQDPNRPHIAFGEYITKTMESIVEYARENKKTTQTTTAIPAKSVTAPPALPNQGALSGSASPDLSYLFKKVNPPTNTTTTTLATAPIKKSPTVKKLFSSPIKTKVVMSKPQTTVNKVNTPPSPGKKSKN